MKVEAYKCDKCKDIVERHDIVGFDGKHDLFDHLNSFSIMDKHPEKTNYHYCLECYRVNVLIPAENRVPKRNTQATDDAFRAICRELGYLLKLSIFNELQGFKK
jgi:hypothetical protein